MEILKVILLAVALLAIGMVGMAVRLLLIKGGRFVNTHVGGNKYLKRQGIHCAQTQDKVEQAKARKELNFKKVSFSRNLETGN